MFKKKLMVLIGAGASIESGVSSVSDVDRLFEKKADVLYKLANNKNLYQYVRDKINIYYRMTKQNKTTNYEEVLYILFTLSSYYKNYNNNALNTFFRRMAFPKIYDSLMKRYRSVNNNDFNSLAKYLIDELFEKIKYDSNNLNTKYYTIENFFKKINRRFNLGIVTTNHDDILIKALPKLFTGFDKSGLFCKNKTLFRLRWKFCYFLHGSIHFEMKNIDREMHKITWSKDLSKSSNQNTAGRNGNNTMEGLNLPTSNIIAGYDKLNQIQREPFRSYYNKIEREIMRTKRLLIIGYGFSDYHVNRIIEIYSENKKIKKRTVVISYTNNNVSPMQFRNDEISRKIINTLTLDRNNIVGEGSKVAVSISELKKENKFEIWEDKKHSFAIWHNGFFNACNNYGKIIKRLL